MKSKRIFNGLLLLMILFYITSCAPVGMTKEAYGFLYGIFHGFISPFVWMAKLLGANIGMHAEHNTGSLYWVGFILGVVLLLGAGVGSYARRRRQSYLVHYLVL
jgi:apolipoprotein N-acyltransferase